MVCEKCNGNGYYYIGIVVPVYDVDANYKVSEKVEEECEDCDGSGEIDD